jgi:hypothetical protein
MITHEIDFTMVLKIKILIAASSIGAVLGKLIQPLSDFLLEEKGFFFLLTIAIVVNMCAGIVKHWKASQLDFKEFIIGTLEVVFICGAGFSLFLAIANIEGVSNTDIGEWFLLLGRITVILYPAGSAFKNMHYITNGRFPSHGFMKRLKKYEKTGNIKSFKNDPSDQQNQKL